MDITEKEEKRFKDIIERVLHSENAYLDNTVVVGGDTYKVSYGDYLIAASLYSIRKDELPVSKLIGKVVQIREKAGIFDTDMFLLRGPDGVLNAIENEVLVVVPPSLVRELDMFYEEHNLEDLDGNAGESEYTISGKDAEIGFIIKDKKELWK